MNNQIRRRMIERHQARCRSYINDGWHVYFTHNLYGTSCYTTFRHPIKAKRLSVYTDERVQRVRVNDVVVSETWFTYHDVDAKPSSANSPT